jgi:rhodanese-related sulfurtransferase
MRLKRWVALSASLLICAAPAFSDRAAAAGGLQDQAQKPPAEAEQITAEELKAKLLKKERVAIIDVRSSESDEKIKGSVGVKYRRLKYRMSMPPLKDVQRDQEIVTYCACPNDEAAVLAARTLSSIGYNRVRVLKGGWSAWKKVGGPVERTIKVTK